MQSSSDFELWIYIALPRFPLQWLFALFGWSSQALLGDPFWDCLFTSVSSCERRYNMDTHFGFRSPNISDLVVFSIDHVRKIFLRLPLAPYRVRFFCAIVLLSASNISLPIYLSWSRTQQIMCKCFSRTCHFALTFLDLCGRSSSFVLPTVLFQSINSVSVFLCRCFISLSNVTRQFANCTAV